MSDIAEEIERLKMKKVEITHRLNLAEFVDEKQDYADELKRIERQIQVLERLKP